MKRTIVGTLALMLLLVAACAGPTKPAVAPPAPEPDRELTDDYLAVIDELLPGMGAENFVDREKPQQEFEQLCFKAGRPGADTERVALCQAMLARLGPETTRPTRVWLLRQLERLSGEESVAGLAILLDDQDARIRELARRALQNNPAPAAGKALRAELLRLEGPTQWHVGLINALAARRDRDQALVHHLIDVARHGDDAMASAAIAALGDLGGPDAVEALYETWGGDNGTCRAWAAAALLRVADRLVTAAEHDRAAKIYLDLYLSSIPTRLRSAALRGLAVAAPDDAVVRLRDVVHGKLDPEMRLQAVRLLGDIPGWLVTNTLVAELNQVPPEVQVVVLDVLATRGDPMVKPAVTDALKSEDHNVRIAALEALPHLGDASDVVLLARAGASADDAEREAARHALARLRGRDVDPAILAAVQEAGDENVRAELIHSLPARYCKLAVAPLFGFAQDDSETVRAAAFAALGQLAPDGQVSRLLGLLVREAGEEAGQAAEDAVVAICLRDADHQRRAKPVLLAYQAQEETMGRVSLIRVLGRLQGAGALASIRPAVRDQDEAVADAAVRALSAWKDIVVLDDLRRLAQSEKQTHHVLALRGYVRLVRVTSDRPASETVRLLETAMSLTRRAEERSLILGALGEVKDLSALKMARSALVNPDVAEEASAAVVSIARGIAGRHAEEARNALDEVAHRRASDGAVKQAEEAIAFIEQHAGYVGVWLYAGPYSEEGKKYDDVFAMAFAPETDDAEQENWQELLASRPDNPWIFDLTRVQRCGNCCLYVRTGIWSEVEQPARLEIGSDDGVKAWLNGELVHSNPSRRGLTVGEDKLEITLRPGWNKLLLKIVQVGGGWGFSCAVRAPDGQPIPGLGFEAK